MRQWWEVIWQCIVVIVGCAAIVFSVGTILIQGDAQTQLTFIERRIAQLEDRIDVMEKAFAEVAGRVDILWVPDGF